MDAGPTPAPNLTHSISAANVAQGTAGGAPFLAYLDNDLLLNLRPAQMACASLRRRVPKTDRICQRGFDVKVGALMAFQ
jgi:hypothetical protein